MMEQTTDNQIVRLSWARVIPVVVAIVFSSNALTAYKYQIDENKQEIQYDKERSDRKDKAAMIEFKQLLYEQELRNEKIMLELKLKECEDTK